MYSNSDTNRLNYQNILLNSLHRSDYCVSPLTVLWCFKFFLFITLSGLEDFWLLHTNQNLDPFFQFYILILSICFWWAFSYKIYPIFASTEFLLENLFLPLWMLPILLYSLFPRLLVDSRFPPSLISFQHIGMSFFSVLYCGYFNIAVFEVFLWHQSLYSLDDQVLFSILEVFLLSRITWKDSGKISFDFISS